MDKTKQIINQASDAPEAIKFEDVIDAVDTEWAYTPTAFTNGSVSNDAGTNEGSCKILGLAQLHDLSKEQTLSLFGRFYRDDVVGNPDGDDHGNIRNFMVSGWDGVSFETFPLAAPE